MQQVSFGVMASARARVRIFANVVIFFSCMGVTDIAIEMGRNARDDPKVPSLYLPKPKNSDVVSPEPFPFGPGPGSQLIH
jgi:hypothetical protein